MARAKQIQAVKVKSLTLAKQTQTLPTITTKIPTSKGVPVVPMHGQMINAIKQSPKGVLPAGLMKYLSQKGQ